MMMPMQDVLDELGKVQFALMEMERIKGSKYTNTVNAVVEARAWLTLISNSGLAAACAHNLNLKLVPLPSKEQTPSE